MKIAIIHSDSDRTPTGATQTLTYRDPSGVDGTADLVGDGVGDADGLVHLLPVIDEDGDETCDSYHTATLETYRWWRDVIDNLEAAEALRGNLLADTPEHAEQIHAAYEESGNDLEGNASAALLALLDLATDITPDLAREAQCDLADARLVTATDAPDQGLRGLCDALNAWELDARAHHNPRKLDEVVDPSDWPNFGGPQPDDVTGIYSWDATHQLVPGNGDPAWEIVERPNGE